jgi:hypothetical protein
MSPAVYDAEQATYPTDAGAVNTMSEIPYKVDTKPQKTSTPDLTVRQILEKAGKTPAESYYLIQKKGNQEEDLKDLDKVISIQPGDHFHAVFVGDMPTS